MRPDFAAEAMTRHRKLLRWACRAAAPPAGERLYSAWRWRGFEEYHNTPHRGKGMDWPTPARRFLREKGELKASASQR